jgi:S-disulfanyl-L-cysteine oxidoreductase SoxD
MSRWREASALVLALATSSLNASAEERFGFGRTPSAAEIDAWDIDVRPDGHGVRPGRGTVAHGQEIYDAKCATCHGTFGESNQYMVIAGGVRAEDLKAGRAAGLRSGDVVRTLGNKLNFATTLWDYIHRAMPWTAPQSLTVDEVYAVTAYVLHLNENLLTLKMPNRDGLTREHGMGRVDAKPDVQGSRCMEHCGPAPHVTSELPSFALNSHGDLRRQFRPFGPLSTIDSTRHESRVATVPVRADVQNPAREILVRHACTACHGFDKAVVGPAFKDVAARYRERGDVAEYLTQKIRNGGVGAWGQVPMPGQSAIKDDEVVAVVRWLIIDAHRGQ